jgi:hypothetical protein
MTGCSGGNSRAPRTIRYLRFLVHRDRIGLAALSAAVVCLVLLPLAFDRSAGARLQAGEATPADESTPVADRGCGERAKSWSEAAANGVRARLVRLRINEPAIAGDLENHHRVAVRVSIFNESDAELPLGLTSFGLVDCDGAVYPAVADPERRELSDRVRPGKDADAWINFVVPESANPVLLVVRIDDGTACRASLEFPLRLQIADGTPVPVDAPLAATPATPATPDPILAPCEGGGATGGASTEGEEEDAEEAEAESDDGVANGDGTGGADGADGADAVGDDAVGGDGCPGEDATGPNAVGGDGGDGGDADSSGQATDATAPVCQDGAAG